MATAAIVDIYAVVITL